MASRFLSEEEDKQLGKIVRNALQTKPSVPSSSPCPAPEIVRALAFHQKLDSATVKETALHIAECYECASLAEKYVNEYQKERKKGVYTSD